MSPTKYSFANFIELYDHGITVIVVSNGLGNLSSNLGRGCSHCSNTLGKGMKAAFFLSSNR